MIINIVYFTYLVPDKWESILLEQLDALYNITTLYEIANIYISAVDDTERQPEIQKLRSIVSEKYPKIQFTNVFSTNLYEYPGIKRVIE